MVIYPDISKAYIQRMSLSGVCVSSAASCFFFFFFFFFFLSLLSLQFSLLFIYM